MAGLTAYEATNVGVFDLCYVDLLQGAVQIRVGLELADIGPAMTYNLAFFRDLREPRQFKA